MANPLNIKTFGKFLGKNKLYTAINIFGLSVSLMFVILIAIYATQELSVDKFHANRDRIYAVGNEQFIGSAYGLSPYLLSRYPEIDKICATWQEAATVEVFNNRYSAKILLADSTFYDMFSFGMIEGDAGTILRSKTDVIVTEEFARKVFGDSDPLGQTLKISDKFTVVVAGIADDIRNSALSESDIIMNMELMEVFFNPDVTKDNLSQASSVVMFVMERPGADLVSKIADMVEYFKEFNPPYTEGYWKEVKLVPLHDIYFSDILINGETIRKGDYAMVIILISVGLLILIFAIINYINLTVAQTGFRAKEMASRRLLGASRGEIFTKFILESIVICAFAFAVGLLLAAAMQNEAGNLLGRQLDVFGSMSWATAGIYIALIILMGVISGVIPAVFISRYKPIDVVKGSFRLRSKMAFSKVFIVFQNVITISLIAAAMTMLLQTRHLIEAPLGWNTENIINVSTAGFRSKDEIDTFRNELKQLGSVKEVSFTRGVPHKQWNAIVRQYKGKIVTLQIFESDPAFFRMLGFELLNQTGLAATDGYWLDETAKFELELGDHDVEVRLGNLAIPVLGTVKNFRLLNILRPDADAVLIKIVQDSENLVPWHTLVEVQGNPDTAFANVRDVYERLTGLEFEGRFIEDEISEGYSTMRQTYTIVAIFTLIAILISMLGLLAMSTYFIQQRASEIAVRKVFGSTRGEMLHRLVFNFMQLVLIAFVMAVPVIWLVMRWWLSSYSYRIPLSPWIFIVAGAFAFLTAFATVLWQSSRAANANPIETIKN
jgi:putative ABC transport system permease protein